MIFFLDYAFSSKTKYRVPVGVSENWVEHVWPCLLKNYADCDIYNANETGLFYRLTPSSTLRFKVETYSGGKLSKDQLTILVKMCLISQFFKKNFFL